MKLLLIILFTPTLLWSQTVIELTDADLNPDSEEVLIKKPEKYLRNESMIYDLNTNLGIKDQRKYTGTDKNRFSISGHVSGDYEHLNELFGLEALYMRRSSRYDRIWWGAQIFQHRTYFDAITANHSTGNNVNSEAQFQRPSDTKNTVLGIGPGVSYRFKLFLDFFDTEDVFENIDIFANYIELDETFIGQKYRGYGLTTSYGLHKRSNTSYFYGGKISYNLASVTRDAIGDEKTRERSLSLGWLSLALELGFFF